MSEFLKYIFLIFMIKAYCPARRRCMEVRQCIERFQKGQLDKLMRTALPAFISPCLNLTPSKYSFLAHLPLGLADPGQWTQTALSYLDMVL